MPSVRDVEPNELVKAAAEKLGKMEQLKPPAWAGYVKTGVHKERPPTQTDWWWIRSASLLRKLYVGQNVGVSAFRKAYGGRKNRGHKPEHKKKASGAVIRKALQQLEAAGLVKTEKAKGRTITPKGRALLDGVARELRKKA